MRYKLYFWNLNTKKNTGFILNSFNKQVVQNIFIRNMHFSVLVVLYSLILLCTPFQHRFYRVMDNFTGSVIGMTQLPSVASCGFYCQKGCQAMQFFSNNSTCKLFENLNDTLTASDSHTIATDLVSFKVCISSDLRITNLHKYTFRFEAFKYWNVM